MRSLPLLRGCPGARLGEWARLGAGQCSVGSRRRRADITAQALSFQRRWAGAQAQSGAHLCAGAWGEVRRDGRCPGWAFAGDVAAGNYRTQMWDKQKEVFLPSTPGLGMHVEVKDPDGKVVLSRQYGSEGRFTFTSHTPGDHQICLHSNSTRMALFAGGKLYREERFRLTSESTNQRVLWWSIAQTVILILTGIWQMRHLKSFFEAKKLV
ncbi:transmembrane emp24 domain-containing protein 4 isoform X3 [Saimiri boliviensis]|uniref:transmembrane emp24 domain-containing protein 4 isoform X3 n=1 Tax=Saimiri boliviensis TaxID=27679 RepID=UPI00193DB664|nr:transmembrane emp24 domain-containing protein 4 isoform X3 [Saimiri boliviensis boliviensis]